MFTASPPGAEGRNGREREGERDMERSPWLTASLPREKLERERKRVGKEKETDIATYVRMCSVQSFVTMLSQFFSSNLLSRTRLRS
jgi:hypothetical protein